MKGGIADYKREGKRNSCFYSECTIAGRTGLLGSTLYGHCNACQRAGRPAHLYYTFYDLLAVHGYRQKEQAGNTITIFHGLTIVSCFFDNVTHQALLQQELSAYTLSTCRYSD